MKEIFRDVEAKMKHAVDHFHQELKHLRTGRASLGMLDGVHGRLLRHADADQPGGYT